MNRVHAELIRLQAERDNFREQMEANAAVNVAFQKEILHLKAERDILAAENRVMRDGIAKAIAQLNDVNSGRMSGVLYAQGYLRTAIEQPHTSREVERVKALERFATEWRRQEKQMRGEGVTGREHHGLYILFKLAMGKELTPDEADDYAALDAVGKSK